MPNAIGYQKIDAPGFVEGKRRSVELPRTDVIHQLIIRARYGVTITGGTGAGAVFADAFARVVDDVRLMAGKKPISAFSGQALALLAKYWAKGSGYIQTPPTSLAAGTEADRESWLAFPFYMPHSKRPHSHAFPASALAVVPMLEIQTANASELFDTDFDGAAAFDADSEYELYMETLLGPDVVKNGRAAGMKYPPLLGATYSREVSQSGTIKMRLSGIEQGEEIRALLIQADSGGVDGGNFTPDASVVEEVRFELDNDDVYGVVSMDAIRQRNAAAYAGISSLVPGAALIDAAEDRQTGPGELWVRRSATSEPTLHLKLAKQTGECRVRVTPITTRRGA